MNTKELIIKLSESVCLGNITESLALVDSLITTGEKKYLTGNNLSVFIKGESEHTLLIDAHIDEIGFIVTDVDDRGFLKVACAGGFDLRTLPSHAVTVHGKEDIFAVFSSVPPHLAKDERTFDDISKLSLDTGLGSRAKELISVGDFVTYRQEAKSLVGNRVCGKSLDNRAGCAVLLLLAEKLKGQSLPFNVNLLFSNQEEIGCRGAKTAAFSLDANEAISIDVSFASFPGIDAHECGKLAKGPMIGYSPVLSRATYDKLCLVAEKEGIPYQREVMGSTTSTNADALSINRDGLVTGLVSVPLRYMHSDCEVIDTKDIENTAELLYKYIMAGGALCD